jgi:hypothetical protein
MSLSRRLLPATFALLTAVAPSFAGDGPQPLRVLFIGNSYTHVNGLPKMIAALARAGKQPPLVHDQETPGGYTLEQHWKNGRAVKKLAAEKWDYVVLQEQSLRPLHDRARMFEYAHKLDAEVRKHGARTLLYQTWARQNAPQKQPELSRAYLDLGKELKARVVPVGMAWERALKEDPKLALHGADQSHPTKAGTYLAACVFYATLYGKSPEGLPGAIGRLSDAEARRLQAIAWRTVRELAEKKKTA